MCAGQRQCIYCSHNLTMPYNLGVMDVRVPFTICRFKGFNVHCNNAPAESLARILYVLSLCYVLRAEQASAVMRAASPCSLSFGIATISLLQAVLAHCRHYAQRQLRHPRKLRHVDHLQQEQQPLPTMYLTMF